MALVLGNEAHGLGDDVLSGLDGLVTIPMAGRGESINVGGGRGRALLRGGPAAPTLGQGCRVSNDDLVDLLPYAVIRLDACRRVVAGNAAAATPHRLPA